MPPKPGSSIYGSDGSSYKVGREIGRGAEGSVWSLEGQPKFVAKFYHNGISPDHSAKLEAMCRLKTEALGKVAAWPLALLSDSRKASPQGLLMRRISEHQSVNQLYGIKSRLRSFPEAQFPFMLHAAMNTARAFATIHDAGQVVGDVNHSNLLISQNATVALIDCDSFQVTEGSQLFYAPMGTPEFTPPELQGAAFRNTYRTPQHDAFGLGVLIFYMLFLGRHPFMGVYDSKAGDILSLEQAIAAYKFPYAMPLNSPEVRLPPFGPHLSDYPVNMKALFSRAFTKDGISQNRPSAQEWIQGLSALAAALKQCASNPSHQYYSSLSSCPWCKVEGTIGIPIFGVKITLIDAAGFNLTAIWAQIVAIQAHPEEPILPDPKALRVQYSPDSSLSEVIRQRRIYRIWSISFVLVLSVLATQFLGTFFALLSIAAALFIGHRIWLKGRAISEVFHQRLIEAESAHSALLSEFKRLSSGPDQFKGAKDRLEKAKRDYQALPEQKAKEFAKIKANQEAKQRQHFLEKFRLEDERIPNIGPKNKAILYTWGILDAWDVNAAAITQIKGFGPVKRDALLTWRAEKERGFRFDPSLPVDPRDIQKLDQDFARKSQDLQNILNAGPNTLRQIVSVWHAQRNQMAHRISAKAAEVAKAQVDVMALRQF